MSTLKAQPDMRTGNVLDVLPVWVQLLPCGVRSTWYHAL